MAHLLELARIDAKQFTMFFALVLIWIVFDVLTNGVFLTNRNLSNLFLQSATLSIVAMGMVLIIVTGNIDLSIGSFVNLVGGVAGVMMRVYQVNPVVVIALCLAIGLLVGAWHGYWIAYRGIPAFVVTLASMLILKGMGLGVLQGRTQSNLAPGFLLIGQGYLRQLGLFKNDSTVFLGISVAVVVVIVMIRSRNNRRRFGFELLPIGLFVVKVLVTILMVLAVFIVFARYLGVPYAILLLMLVAVGLSYLSNNTVFGRQLYAIGGNSEAARLSGIDIRQRLFLLYMLMGFLTATGAIVYTSRLGAATVSSGLLLELDAIAAAVIGGASLAGGIGTIPGAVVGALVMSSLDNGMSLMNLYVTYQYVIKGLILLLAVWSDIALRRQK